MYDDEEQIHNLERLAQKGEQSAQRGIRIAKEIYRLAIRLSEREDIPIKQAIYMARRELLNPNPDFIFTGQVTDLNYFQYASAMPIDYIENIQDEKLKSAVKDEFNKMARNGEIVIDPDSQMIVITDKGKAKIANQDFKNQAIENMAEVEKSLDQAFVLDGTEKDLEIFNHVESFNLSDLQNTGTPEHGEKVLSNIKKLSDKKLLSISPNGNVTITAVGKNVLTKNATSIGGKVIGKSVATKAVGSLGTVGAVIVVVKKAADMAKAVLASQIK